jgi:hypothetical protein
MLMLLGAFVVAWLLALAIVLGLCVSAARGDRAMQRMPRVSQRGPGLRLIA